VSALAAVDGSKFKAVNTRDKNFTATKLKKRMELWEVQATEARNARRCNLVPSIVIAAPLEATNAPVRANDPPRAKKGNAAALASGGVFAARLPVA
jgi:hypothetical protein